MEGLCKRYDAARSDHLAITVKSFYGDEYTVDLFIQKLSAEIMAGRGPDWIYFNLYDRQNLSDVQKMVSSGAFSTCDEILQTEEWQQDQYFSSVWEDANHDDGKVYVLPIEVDYAMIHTTPQAMKQNGVTEADLKNSIRLLSVLQRITEISESPVCWGAPLPDTLFSGVCDYSTGKTTISDEPIFSALQNWNTLFGEQDSVWDFDI